MKELLIGKKVRIKSWPKDHFIGLQEEQVLVFGKKKKKYTVLNQNMLPINTLDSFSAYVNAQWQCLDEDDDDE